MKSSLRKGRWVTCYLITGITIEDQELIFCLENLKKGEISSFRIERVTYTDKKKRIMESEKHIIAEMKDWETIIDMDGDMLAMKHLHVRGTGQKRCGMFDIATFTCKIYQIEDKPLLEYNVVDKVPTRVEPAPPNTLLNILMSAKAKEECVVEVKQEYINLYEKSDSFKAMLNPFKPVYFDLKLDSF